MDRGGVKKLRESRYTVNPDFETFIRGRQGNRETARSGVTDEIRNFFGASDCANISDEINNNNNNNNFFL